MELCFIMRLPWLILLLTLKCIFCNGMTSIEIDDYLRTYGYVLDRMPGTGIPLSADDREYGIKCFQNFNNLEVTGSVNEITSQWMKKLRCGCNDFPMPEKKIMIRTRRDLSQFKPVEFITNRKWKKTYLTYHIVQERYTTQIHKSYVDLEIARAFKAWTDVSALEISRTNDPGVADIVISFATRVHDDNSPFDGEGGVLAHAYYPETGVAHFDDDEVWVVNKTGVDLFTVAAHEFGHSLGLAHSTVGEALMAPFYAGYKPNYQLHPDDIAGIQSLYGPNTNRPRTPRPTTLAPVTQRPTVTRRPPVTRRTRPTQPPLPPRTTPLSPNTPAVCNFQFKSVTKDNNGDILAFNSNGDVLKMTQRGGMYDQTKISDMFPNAQTHFDDVVNSPAAGTVFLRRVIQWKYQVKPGTVSDRELTVQKFIPHARRLLREKINAVFAISQNQAYLVGDYFMMEYSVQEMEIIPSSYTYVRDTFPGLPRDVDSAVALDARNVYFFKDNQYWRFDMPSRRLVGGPYPVAPRFIKGPCT